MQIEIKVPSPGESVTQVQLASWLVSNGDVVEKDQEIAEIDSDKATLTVNAEEGGKISLLIEEGDTVEVDSVIARIDTSVKAGPDKKTKKEEPAEKKAAPEESAEAPAQEKETEKAGKKEKPAEEAEDKSREKKPPTEKSSWEEAVHLSPLAKKLMQENGISEKDLIEFLKGYRISRKDVDFMLDKKSGITPEADASRGGDRETERKRMTTLRLKIAERLVAAKNETAMLTTFNEVDMSAIMDIRKKYKEIFKEKHGIGLGFMSFFTKAITWALEIFPQVNAMLDGEEMVFHNYADIGIAVSSPKGLMVPILRNAEKMSMAEIELSIKELADKARNNKISLDEMTGGTFTITNGGVFGSMLSTPILNPPQSAILGMHNIVERPVAVSGKVEIRPVMYVALSYDHRIIDGRESVSFLVKVKEMLENPAGMLTGGKDPMKVLLDL